MPLIALIYSCNLLGGSNSLVTYKNGTVRCGYQGGQGAIAWHDSYAGWHVTYGGTTAGWHECVQSHMKAFFDKQSKEGRIPALLEEDQIYSMGKVLCDQALYDWEWTGDPEPFRKGGNAITRHLDWGEKYLKTPDGLYENFMNAWNADYKWCNGGGGTIASVYN